MANLMDFLAEAFMKALRPKLAEAVDKEFDRLRLKLLQLADETVGHITEPLEEKADKIIDAFNKLGNLKDRFKF